MQIERFATVKRRSEYAGLNQVWDEFFPKVMRPHAPAHWLI